MKKLFALLTIAGMLTFGLSTVVFAQDTEATDTEMTTDTTAAEVATTNVVSTLEDEPVVERTIHRR